MDNSGTSSTSEVHAIPSAAAAAAVNTTKDTGRVKWFNNKSGYGFITVVSAEDAGESAVSVGMDVFAHHSEVTVGEDQYRYLVQGEYVEFSVCKSSSGQHEFQCSAIRGIRGGQLICETRHAAREQYKTSAPSSTPTPSSTSNPLEASASAKYSVGRAGGFAGSRPFRGRGGSSNNNSSGMRGGFKQ